MNIYFNFFSVLALLSTIVPFILALYLLSLRKASRMSRLFGLGFTCLTFFVGAYVFGYVTFEEAGAYHRYLTVPFVLLSLMFFGWATYEYGANTFPREYKVMQWLMPLGILANYAYFIVETYQQTPFYIFDGHFFNFEGGQVTSYAIIGYMMIVVIIAARKYFVLDRENRTALLQLMGSVIFITLVPGITNRLSLSGLVTRETHQTIFAITIIIGYFFILLIYINQTIDRTTFMVKIVGISVCAMLILVQGIAMFVIPNEEKFFNQISKATAKRSVETEPAGDVRYIYRLAEGKKKDRFLFKADDVGLTKKQLRPNGSSCSGPARLSKADTLLDDGRVYRCDPQSGALFVAFQFEHNKYLYEVGFPYLRLREFIHHTSFFLALIAVGLTLFILIIFPLFFRVSLITPLNRLLEGVTAVNDGRLDVRIPISVNDEIGFLSGSFNGMVESIADAKKALQDYADHLEEKVEERTREVTEKMEEIKSLKVQQDGDYFLTSLIAQPLASNRNRSQITRSTMYVEQKKKFVFRERKAEIGGDICMTGNLRFGTRAETYTMFANGDAMGKSMQGAGGAIVLGTSLNNIMARSADGGRVIKDQTPKQWLTGTYHELDNIFKTFDGSMMTSLVMGLINDETGRLLYFNCEHPWTIRMRDGKAEFIETELTQRKLGSLSEFIFEIKEFQLEKGDVLIVGSDGRDDLLFGHTESGERIINEDETLFLKIVEEGGADLDRIAEKIHSAGGVTDDLSLIRIGYREDEVEDTGGLTAAYKLYLEAKHQFESGRPADSIATLRRALLEDPKHHESLHLLAQLVYRERNFADAIPLLKAYLEQEPGAANFWFYLSVCYKQIEDFRNAKISAEKVREFQPLRTANLVNLADCYRMLGEYDRAEATARRALELEPEKEAARKLLAVLQARK